MHLPLFYIATSLFALATAQQRANPFTLPPGFMITAGEPTTISWDPTTQGTVSIRLRQGASSNLEEGIVIASNIDNSGRATITLPEDTTRNSDYALQIISDENPTTDVNYSGPFVVESENTVEPISTPASSGAVTNTTGSTTTMSTRTGSSTSTRSTGTSNPTSSARSPTSSAASSTTGAPAEPTISAPDSGAMSLKVHCLLLIALIGAPIAW
ncbi:MAG: hypothetical protein L6R35_001926 [Caloplaca aegaea]|nr:MAG: hypothetical protein L6R35_001926 [Caloplaca aegaea]